MMTKTIVVLFVLLVFCTVNATKELIEGKSEEKADSSEDIKNNNNDDDEKDESASIQVVYKDVVKDTIHNISLQNGDNQEKEDHLIKDTNSTKDSLKYDNIFEELISDSDDIILATNPEDKIEEVLIPSGTTINENNDYSNRKEEIEIVFEQITKASNLNENYEEDSSALNEDENNWRSAENSHSDNNSNEGISPEDDDSDYSAEDYMDKKIGWNGKGRTEVRKPGRKEHSTMPMNVRQYGLPDEHILDSVPRRNFGEMVVPRYRPTLTRNGIVYTPTFYTVQTPSPVLERMSGHNWGQNRPNFNQEREIFSRPRQNKIIGVSPYELDSKMIDDYNDYGSNTYSYTPVMKVTTLAPPQQIMSPNKFDIFQKLVEASNQPKLTKRTFNDNGFAGNYYPQRQYSDSYGAFDGRRLRRNVWDELHFQDI